MKILWKQFLLSFLIISLILFLFTVFIISELKKYDESLTEERLFTAASLLREVLKTPILNLGSVGQPKDFNSRAYYAVIENGEAIIKRVKIRH